MFSCVSVLLQLAIAIAGLRHFLPTSHPLSLRCQGPILLHAKHMYCHQIMHPMQYNCSICSGCNIIMMLQYMFYSHLYPSLSKLLKCEVCHSCEWAEHYVQGIVWRILSKSVSDAGKFHFWKTGEGFLTGLNHRFCCLAINQCGYNWTWEIQTQTLAQQ